METVFDHNITKQEWNYIRGTDKSKYLSCVDPQMAIWDLASLFYIRGNIQLAETYSEKLPDLRKYDL